MNNNTNQLSLFPEKVILRHVVKDGLDLYFDAKSGLTGTSINGLARLVGCQSKTINEAIKILDTVKRTEAYTQGGLQNISFIELKDIPVILLKIMTKNKTHPRNKINSQKLLELCTKHGIEEGMRLFKPIKTQEKKSDLPFVNEVSVANYLRDIHEYVGDQVKLQPTITLGYRPDMMIYTPETDMLCAVEVEPYDRRKYGLQQAITYGKLSNALPYLVTFGINDMCPNESLTLANYRILWGHLKIKSYTTFKGVEIQNNISQIV